jgi:hypothetical protein
VSVYLIIGRNGPRYIGTVRSEEMNASLITLNVRYSLLSYYAKLVCIVLLSFPILGCDSEPAAKREFPGHPVLEILNDSNDAQLSTEGIDQEPSDIHVKGGVLTNDQWNELKKYKSIKTLFVGDIDTQLDVVIEVARTLPILQSFSVHVTRISAESFAGIAELSGLKSLHVTQCIVHSGKVSQLKSLSSLEHLYLSRSKLPGGFLHGIDRAPNLKMIFVREMDLGADDYALISKCEAITRLGFSGRTVVASAVGNLVHLKHLSSLYLSGCVMTEEMARQLSKFPALQKLEHLGPKVDARIITILASNPALRELRIVQSIDPAILDAIEAKHGALSIQ